MMHIYTAEQTAKRLPFPALIESMRQLFADAVRCPNRHSHTIELPNECDGSLLLMPSWHGDIGCVKMVTVIPENGKRHLPAVAASVLVFDRHTGEHLAMLDGDTVTVKRTAAASALAADYLAPKNAERLLIIGSGKVAEQLPAAFSAVRPIRQVSIWNRNILGAEKLAVKLKEQGIAAQAVNELDKAVREADIISAATLATEPLIKGEWLSGRQHVDLIGSFAANMREADDEVFRRAAIYIDSPFAAKESGEILIPIQNGVICSDDIIGDLYDLASAKVHYHYDNHMTVFKGAGNAVMDLAAAITVLAE